MTVQLPDYPKGHSPPDTSKVHAVLQELVCSVFLGFNSDAGVKYPVKYVQFPLISILIKCYIGRFQLQMLKFFTLYLQAK